MSTTNSKHFGAPVKIARQMDPAPPTITVDPDPANCDGWNKRNGAWGAFSVPADSSITLITWYGDLGDGVQLPLYQADGTTPVTSTVQASGIFPLPDECGACAVLYAVGDQAGSIVAQQLG